jgi:hypothetical protein
MYEDRNLRQEVNDLEIVSMEDVGLGSRESVFAALDAIREHNKQYPEERLAEMMIDARRAAVESMAGTGGRKGEN